MDHGGHFGKRATASIDHVTRFTQSCQQSLWLGPAFDFRLSVGVGATSVGNGSLQTTQFVHQSVMLGLPTSPNLALRQILNLRHVQITTFRNKGLEIIVVTVDVVRKVLLDERIERLEWMRGCRIWSGGNVLHADTVFLGKSRKVELDGKDANRSSNGGWKSKDSLGSRCNVVTPTGTDIAHGTHDWLWQIVAFLKNAFGRRDGTTG
mmetsp:Transcript_26210/g.43753  ORF Transcript_26210/g.43753 Transcript_26210/m.43753 type:complete len:207 (-) Transcript_26210:1727-2347(-)